MSEIRNVAFRLLGLVIGLALACGGAELAVRAVSRVDEAGSVSVAQLELEPFQPDPEGVRSLLDGILEGRRTTDYHPRLGWTLGASRCNLDGRRRTDDRGFRVGEAGARPHRGNPRVVALGDSFTFGAEVEYEESWPAHLERLLGPQAEVLNLGVPAYGIDQAVLRFEERGPELRPDCVVLGLVSADLRRNVNIFRCFLQQTDWPLSKPRFVLEPSGELTLVNSPCISPEDMPAVLADSHHPMRKHDLWCPPSWLSVGGGGSRLVAFLLASARERQRQRAERVVMSPGREGLDLATAILRRLRDAAANSGATLYCVYIPEARETQGVTELARQGLLEAARALGIPAADPTPRLQKLAAKRGIRTLYVGGGGHCTNLGNRLVAEEVRSRILSGVAGEGSGPEAQIP